MSEYIITDKQIEELNKAHGGMQILTSWLSAYAIFDTSEFPPLMKSEHLAITLPNVVRCKDCKYYYEADNYHPSGNYVRRCCKYFDTYDDEVMPDGFCSWGERIEG